MNQKLRAFLEANGLRADASEQDAWAHYDKLIADGVKIEGMEIGVRSAAPAPAQPAAAAPAAPAAPAAQAAPAVDVDAAVARALVQEAHRRNDIEDRLRIAGLMDADNGDFARSLLNDTTMSVERASTAIFKRLAASNPPVGAGAFSGASVGVESREKLRAAITDGLLQRAGHRIEKPAAGSREFRGRHMVEIVRELMHAAGMNTRGMGNMEMVGRALASGNSTDFPLILGALVNKNLLRAYDEWPATWRPFVGIRPANDFKLLYSLKLSGSPDLQGLNENGEYKTASFSESGESFRVITKGIKVPLTRTMIINDDTGAFNRIPQLFGAAARRFEGDSVYSLITANGTMSDGVALFHADHGNLAGTAGAPTSDTLSAGRSSMRLQTGLKGESLDIQPAFWLGPVVLETAADILLMSMAMPTAEMSSGVKNPWAGKLTPITDPRLDANSSTAWYLVAHPNQQAFIEVAYLEGEEQPYVEEQVDFNSDALVIKVRHDFGAGVADHVGAYKNAGG